MLWRDQTSQTRHCYWDAWSHGQVPFKQLTFINFNVQLLHDSAMRATALHSPIGLYWKEIMRGFLQQLFMTVFLDSCGRFALQWLNRLIWMHLNPWTPSTLASASSSFFQAPMFLILKLESRKTQNKTKSTCLLRHVWSTLGMLPLIFRGRPLHTGIENILSTLRSDKLIPKKKLKNHPGQAEWCTECPLKRRCPSCMAPHAKTTGSKQQGFEPKKRPGGTQRVTETCQNCTQETDLRSAY